MSSREDIKKDIESDIKIWEETLKNRGYNEKDVRNLLSKLSPDTVESIKNNPDKMAEIIEKLIKKSEEDEDDENYIELSDEIDDKELKEIEEKKDFGKGI